MLLGSNKAFDITKTPLEAGASQAVTIGQQGRNKSTFAEKMFTDCVNVVCEPRAILFSKTIVFFFNHGITYQLTIY